jgi:hypothetical protein
MILQISPDDGYYSGGQFLVSDEEAKALKKRLWSPELIKDWSVISLGKVDPSLPIADFFSLPMVGGVAVWASVLDDVDVDRYLADTQLLPMRFEGKECYFIKPSVRAECLNLKETRRSSLVFNLGVSPIPWFFRVEESARIFSAAGAESFIEWYTKRGLSGLQFNQMPLTEGGEIVTEKRDVEVRRRTMVSNFDASPVGSSGNSSRLDLEGEKLEVHAELAETFVHFHAAQPDAEVCAIEVRFDKDPGGYEVHIDTRPRYAPGSWGEMEFADYGAFLKERWGQFFHAMGDSGTSLRTAEGDELDFSPLQDGSKCLSVLPPRYESDDPDGGILVMALGEMITQVMKQLVSSGMFKEWRLRSGAIFVVAETTHVFHTPFSGGCEFELIQRSKS